jgi:hypothetical protein
VSRKEVSYVVNTLIQKIDKFIEEHYYEIDGFIDDYILELFVWIPWFENGIRSHRLSEKDIKAMSRKGYKVFDGDTGRFVKEFPPAVLSRFK